MDVSVVTHSLTLMWQGMVAIFAVILIIYFVLLLLGKKKKKTEQK